jgi:hypothetical protein
MRRLVTQSTVVAVTAITIGVLCDDRSQANVANEIRSGVHGMNLAASGAQFAPERGSCEDGRSWRRLPCERSLWRLQFQ